MVPSVSTNVGLIFKAAPTSAPPIAKFDAKTVQNPWTQYLLNCDVRAVAQQAVMNASGKTATPIEKTTAETRPPQTPQNIDKPTRLLIALADLIIVGAVLALMYSVSALSDT